MIELPVYSMSGNRVGAMETKEDIVGSHVGFDLLKRVIIASERNRRRGTASTKERGEITGSTRKPWRQKGTGNARAGSRKSPIWRGGGTIFGPRPRDYSARVSRKERRGALKSALLLKLREEQIKVVRDLKMAKAKTKDLGSLLEKIGAAKDCLLVVSEFDRNLWLSARNMPSVDIVTVDELDARGVASRKNIVLAEDAMVAIGKK